jgi:hypothetical protein
MHADSVLTNQTIYDENILCGKSLVYHLLVRAAHTCTLPRQTKSLFHSNNIIHMSFLLEVNTIPPLPTHPTRPAVHLCENLVHHLFCCVQIIFRPTKHYGTAATTVLCVMCCCVKICATAW